MECEKKYEIIKIAREMPRVFLDNLKSDTVKI